MSTIQLKCTKTNCNFANANTKMAQGAKFMMLFAAKQVALQTQMPSLYSIIKNSGSNRIANANANANTQCE